MKQRLGQVTTINGFFLTEMPGILLRIFNLVKPTTPGQKTKLVAGQALCCYNRRWIVPAE